MIIMPESYNFNLACENCNTTTRLRIPLGITVTKYAMDKTCPACGCKLADTGFHSSYHPPKIVVPMMYPFGIRGEK